MAPAISTAQTDREPPLAEVEDAIREGLDRLNDRGVYPDVGSIVSGSGLAFGIGLRGDELGDSPFAADAEAKWSIRGYHKYQTTIGWIAGKRQSLVLPAADANIHALFGQSGSIARSHAAYLAVQYRRSPRVDFFGAAQDGNITRTDFAVSGVSLDAVVQWQPTTTFGVAARAGMLDLDVGSGTDERLPGIEQRFGAAEAPGLLAQPRYFTVGVAAASDTRDTRRMPTKGGFLGAGVWRFVPLGSEKGFVRLALDWREYRALGSNRHVAALRLLASVDHGAGDSATPFYLQSWLGGSYSLRGFQSYRFRGGALAHLSAEYRWRLARYVEIAPFVDAGIVSPRLSQFSIRDLHVTPGVGVRLRDDDRMLVRVDWAWRDSGGHRVLFSLTPVF
jgi:hypothetical protein